MRLEPLKKLNYRDYEPFLKSDEAENIDRDCYKGFLAYDEDDKALGALMYLIKNAAENGVEDEITYFSTENVEAVYDLLSGHDRDIDDEGVKKTYYESASASEDIKKALKDAAFTVRNKESRDLCITVDDLTEAKIPKKKSPDYVLPLGKISDDDFWNGVINCVYHDRKGLIEDFEVIPKSFFEQDLSCCVITDRIVEGFLLVHRTASGILMPLLFYCGGRDRKKNLFFMMRYTLSAAEKKYPGETRIVLRRHNQAIKALTDYIFPGVKGNMVMVAERD